MTRWRLLLPFAWMAVLWALSSIPSHADGELGGFTIPPWLQNGAHAVVYGILAAAWFWALGPDRPSSARRALGACVAYGMVDELHQAFVPGRTSSFLDLMVDALGALLVLSALLSRRQGRLPSVSSSPSSSHPPPRP